MGPPVANSLSSALATGATIAAVAAPLRCSRRALLPSGAAAGVRARARQAVRATAAYPEEPAQMHESAPGGYAFVTQEAEQAEGLAAAVCSVDCSHPTAMTLTHHKGNNNPPGLKASDSSTGLVLNALRSAADHPAQQWLRQPFVSTNHFDIDALTSVWAYLNRDMALQFEDVLKLVGHLGDFREAPLGEISAGNAEVDAALKLCCWLNTLERQRFSKPWEVKDSEDKFEWFLPRFQDALADPDSVRHDWEAEYSQVMQGFHSLEDRVQVHTDLGLAIARPEAPLHYYALFSRSIGQDVLVTMYPGNRYEVEAKYTQYVEFHSRGVWPRLDFAPLVKVLNKLEAAAGTDLEKLAWNGDRLVYGGPLLRLDRPGEKLSTVQKYGHPTERPIYASAILPERFEAVVISFYAQGLAGSAPRAGGWSWEELKHLNRALDWEPWAAGVLAEG
eukprot:jgi/Tetstr1/442466/TSEL_003212.t1